MGIPAQVSIGRRFIWWAPDRENGFRPKLWSGSDEWCHKSACLTLPLLGSFIVFWEREWRTMPCDEEWALMDETTRADYLPGGYLEGGRVHQDRTPAWELG